jgi:hypothetical protein
MVDPSTLLGCYVAYADLYHSIQLFCKAIWTCYVHTVQTAVCRGHVTYTWYGLQYVVDMIKSAALVSQIKADGKRTSLTWN